MKQNRKTIEKVNETKSSFFESINKIHKPLARLMKKLPYRNKTDTKRIL